MAIDVRELSTPAAVRLATPAPCSPLDVSGPAPLDALTEWFRAASLPVPPVPVALHHQLEQVAPTVWSTNGLDPWRLVDNDRAIAGLEQNGHVEQITIGHVGRRTETSRITYQLAHRGLGIVATCFWRETQRSHDAEVIDQTFFALAALLDDLRPSLEDRWHERPGLLVEVHGRSVRWWRPDHDLDPSPGVPTSGASWTGLAREVCIDPPGWRVRVLDRLPRP